METHPALQYGSNYATKPTGSQREKIRLFRGFGCLSLIPDLTEATHAAHSTSACVSIPWGEAPSTTPRTPRPCSGLSHDHLERIAVAQKMAANFGISRMRPSTVDG